jgi:hypothetical protein
MHHLCKLFPFFLLFETFRFLRLLNQYLLSLTQISASHLLPGMFHKSLYRKPKASVSEANTLE